MKKEQRWSIGFEKKQGEQIQIEGNEMENDGVEITLRYSVARSCGRTIFVSTTVKQTLSYFSIASFLCPDAAEWK